MKNYITAHSIANTVRMSRSLHKGAFLIVEGDKDARIYKRFIREKSCKVIPAYGKPNAVDALAILERDNFKGVLAIVDADFWHLEKYNPESENLLVTDFHDLETMILSNSEVMDKMLSEFGSPEGIKALNKPLMNLILDAALPLGLLRWIASPSRDNLSLKFKGLEFANFIDSMKLEINIDSLLGEIRKNSENSSFDEETIKTKIQILKEENHPPWQVCSGHDMVEILTMGFRWVFGNQSGIRLNIIMLDKMLRIAYEYSHFQLSLLYLSIRNWEKANPAYTVLKDE